MSSRAAKRLLSLVLTVCVLLGSASGLAESASKRTPASRFRLSAVEGGLRVDRLLKNEADVSVPAYIGGVPVAEIGDAAFAGRGKLKKVGLPATVKTVGARAFANCKRLCEVYVSQGAQSIGAGAFANCKKLSALTLPQSVASIDESAFGAGMSVTVYAPLGSFAETFVKQYKGPAKLKYAQPRGDGVMSIYVEGPNSLGAGDAARLSAVAIPGGNEVSGVIWKSSRPGVVAVDETTGEAAGLKAGKAVISAVWGNLSATHEIKVSAAGALDAESLEALFAQNAGDKPIGRLARLSIDLAGDAYYKDEAAKTLKILGFNDIYAYNYPEPTLDNTVPFTLGRRALRINGESFTLYVAMISGTHTTGKEWLSNVELGSGTEHRGFSLAGNEVYEKLVKLIGDGDKAKTKIWLAGYSRGAAALNCVAKRLWDAGYNTGNLYAYTFACPAVTKKPDPAAGVFNYAIDGDLVPKTPLAKWGYGRNGTTIVLKDGTDVFNKMKTVYKKMFKINYTALTGKGADAIATFLYDAANVDEFRSFVNYLRKYAPEETAYAIESLWKGPAGSLIWACTKLIWKLTFGLPESGGQDETQNRVVKLILEFIEVVKAVYKAGSKTLNAHESEMYLCWMIAQYGE